MNMTRLRPALNMLLKSKTKPLLIQKQAPFKHYLFSSFIDCLLFKGVKVVYNKENPDIKTKHRDTQYTQFQMVYIKINPNIEVHSTRKNYI